MKTIQKSGSELVVGDYAKVWWSKMERLLDIRPHSKYEEMFGVPARIGNFGGTEMTIEPHMMYAVYIP